LLAVGAAAALLGGCSHAPIPLAKNFELTYEHKVRSVGHWELVSRDVVKQTAAQLEKAGVGANQQLHVALPTRATAFDRGFREFLITQMVQGGRVVMADPGPNALNVTYQTQVVRHNSARPHFVPGLFTALAAGVMVAHGLRNEHVDLQLAALLGLAVAGDYGASVNSGGPTHTELILSTTVTRGGQFISRKTDVYYLENDDASLFVPAPTPYRATEMRVVSQ
jgi:hypothetical protein